MSGELVILGGGAGGRISDYVRALRRLPTMPSWVLVGGLAVNVRLGRLHRATNDVDTVSDDQPRLVEILISADDADSLSAAKVQFHDPEVEVDVMDSTERHDLPANGSDRAFALVRRWTMRTAATVDLRVVDASGHIVQSVEVQVASRPALVALKIVSIPRRREGGYPLKEGSDIQDLFRLVEGQDFDALADAFTTLDQEARLWVADRLSRTFSAGSSDLRYALVRLRRYSDNVDSRSIEEEDLALLGRLGLVLASCSKPASIGDGASWSSTTAPSSPAPAYTEKPAGPLLRDALLTQLHERQALAAIHARRLAAVSSHVLRPGTSLRIPDRTRSSSSVRLRPVNRMTSASGTVARASSLAGEVPTRA